MLRHTLSFVPAHRAGGWSISDEGRTRCWWRAQLNKQEHLVLSDGSDAHAHEGDVQLAVKEPDNDEAAAPASEDSLLLAPSYSGNFLVHLIVSQGTFDRVLQAVQRREPPTVTIGFGTEDRYRKLTTGPIINVDDAPFHYRWNHDKEPRVVIESHEFAFSAAQEDAEAPEIPEKPPTVLRVLGIVWGVFVNLLKVLVAIAVLNVANTPFETAVVSILLLFYVYWASSRLVLAQTVGRLELGALARFYSLRALLGLPASDGENKYMRHAREKMDKPSYRFWMDSVASSIIGLLVLYKLGTLLF
jgi:hypothetical protein